jgi:hypothetical protein
MTAHWLQHNKCILRLVYIAMLKSCAVSLHVLCLCLQGPQA